MKILNILMFSRNEDNIKQLKKVVQDIPFTAVNTEPFFETALEDNVLADSDMIMIDYKDYDHEKIAEFINKYRRSEARYLPIVVLLPSQKPTGLNIIKANDFASLYGDEEDLKDVIHNMKALLEFMKGLQKRQVESTDNDGSISRKEFYKIFLTALDRYDRYGEPTYLTLVTIDNYQDIKLMGGEVVANDLCCKLKDFILKISRMSDYVSRTGENEMCIMLVRPYRQEETQLTFDRVLLALRKNQDLFSSGTVKGNIRVTMVNMPDARVIHEEEL